MTTTSIDEGKLEAFMGQAVTDMAHQRCLRGNETLSPAAWSTQLVASLGRTGKRGGDEWSPPGRSVDVMEATGGNSRSMELNAARVAAREAPPSSARARGRGSAPWPASARPSASAATFLLSCLTAPTAKMLRSLCPDGGLTAVSALCPLPEAYPDPWGAD